MPSSYYDAIVLGGEIAPLFCAALLARRGFRVLVLGHEYLSPTYQVGEYRLASYPFALVGAHSPIARRLFSELGLNQRLRRIAAAPRPAFQLALPGHRLDITGDPAALEREISREFPNVKRSLEDFHRDVAQVSEQLDKIIEHDLVWPPETFAEKREFTRASGQQPFYRSGKSQDLLAECPEEHPFRLAARQPAYFSGAIDPDQMNSLRLARLYANWRFRAAVLDRGSESLRDLLLDKIKSHSGMVRLHERVGEVLVRRGAVCGVRMDASNEEIGGNTVIAGIELASLLHILPERALFEELFERIGEPQLRYYRYTLNLVAESIGVPIGMGRDVFYMRRADARSESENLLHIQSEPIDQRRHLLCVEALVPRRKIEDLPGYLNRMRETLLEYLGEFLPFLARHLIAIDSPHDGRPPEAVRGKAEPAGVPIAGVRRGLETMSQVYSYPVLSGLGVCAMPIRTPIRRLLLCNGQVVPGFGLEGLLLTAWSAARIATRSDRSRKWLCRGLWTKVEI